MKRYVFLATACALFLGYSAEAKNVLLTDSTFIGDTTLKSVMKHYYSGVGINILDSLFTATGSFLNDFYDKYYDDSARLAILFYRTKVPNGVGNRWKHIYVYNSKNCVVADTQYTNYTNLNPERPKGFNLDSWVLTKYDASNKKTNDSTFDFKGRLLGYSIYAYTDSGTFVAYYDSARKVTGYTEYIKKTGDTLIVKGKSLDTGKVLTGYWTNTYNGSNKLIKVISYGKTKTDTTIHVLSSTRYGYGEVGVRYWKPGKTGVSLVSSLRINPAANGTCELSFTLASPSNVKAELFSLSGRLIASVCDKPFTAGSHSFSLGHLGIGSDYLIRISTNSGVISQRFTLY